MKIFKRILKIIGIIVAVLVILVFAAILFIDHIAKGAVENVVPLVAGVSCKVDSISIKPFAARVEINQLVLGNPEGYTSENAVSLGKVVFDLDMTTLFNKKIVIEEVCLQDVKVNYETPITFNRSNLQDIIARLDSAAAKEEEEAQQAAEPAQKPPADEANSQAENKPEEPKKEQPRLQLNKLIVKNIQLWGIPRLEAGGFSIQGADVKVPLIVTFPEMGPMGTSEEGLTPMGLLKESSDGIYQGIYTSVMQSKDVIMEQFMKAKDAAKESFQQISESAKNTAEDLQKSFKNGGEDLDKTVRDASHTLKSIFKKK